MARTPIIYTWAVTDHRMNRRHTGQENNRAAAQGKALEQVRRIGRGLSAVQATVFRPSGGGWWLRAQAPAARQLSPALWWEEWEAIDG